MKAIPVLSTLIPKLEWVREVIVEFAYGFREGIEGGKRLDDACRDLHEALKEAGVKSKEPTFSDYLREAHGIGK
jgi:hypothetical protein